MLDTVASPTLPDLLEEATNPVGTSVATLLGSQIWDADAGALAGLAVTGITGGGIWQFSLDGGTTWQALGAVSPGAARLLRATDQVRFVPTLNFNGPATLSYVAWDQTQGTAGSLASTLVAGGSAPFSQETETASVTVNPVNDRPSLTPPSVITILPPLAPGTSSPPAIPVSQLLAGLVSDPDGADSAGVALVGLTGIVGGRWEFSLDGGATWTQFTAATPTAALLLRASDLLRFTPFNSFAGTTTLTYRAWDQSQGTAGTTMDVGTLAEDGAFSVETNIVYLPVNTAPSLRS
ncbi:MAG: Ig-like domain-containing protein [Gemmataceae bacterium]